MDFTWYASIGGIVAATMIIVAVMKRVFAKVSWISTPPTWAWSIVIAAVLAESSHLAGFIPGNDFELIMQAVMLAAIAGGFQGWYQAGLAPMSDSSVSVATRAKNGGT